MKLKLLFLKILLMLGIIPTLQAQTFVVKGNSLTYDIGKYVQTLYDTEGILTIDNILLPTQQARFKKENNLKKEVKQHWYKIEIDNQTDKPFFYLDVYNSLHSELYVVQGERITRFANGMQTPLKERAYLGSLSQYPLQIGKGKTTLYLAYRYLNTCAECLGKKYFWLHEPQSLFRNYMSNNIIGFSVLSILIALAIYNLFIYFLVKDQSYLYYVLSIFCVTVYLFLDLLHIVWFKPDQIEYLQMAILASNTIGGIATVFFIKFSQSFLHTYLAYPKWHKGLQIFQWCVIGVTLMAFLGLLFGNQYRILENITIFLYNLTIGILAIFLLVLSVRVWQSKHLTGKYYAYSNALFFVCVILYVGGLSQIRLYNHTFLTYHSFKIGVAVQMMLFSVALAGRINLLKQEIADKKLENERLEKEKAIEIQQLTAQKNVELEQKVKERTADLEKSNEEIRSQAEEIERQARLLDDQKNRQLMEKTLQVLQKNEILPEITKFLESLNTQLNGETKQQSKELQKRLSQMLSTDTQWENLKAHFEEVHPTLFAKLYERCPELSPNDLRHCAYQKMGLSKKEIATLLNLDPESVRKHQYRIKQKLKLDENTSFSDFIMSVH